MSNPTNENINGYSVSVYKNSNGDTYYLYEGHHPNHGYIYAWMSDTPRGKITSYDITYIPCTIPSGFDIIETENKHHPLLRKK